MLLCAPWGEYICFLGLTDKVNPVLFSWPCLFSLFLGVFLDLHDGHIAWKIPDKTTWLVELCELPAESNSTQKAPVLDYFWLVLTCYNDTIKFSPLALSLHICLNTLILVLLDLFMGGGMVVHTVNRRVLPCMLSAFSPPSSQSNDMLVRLIGNAGFG